MNRLKEAALKYAKMGWHIVPLHSAIDGVCDCRMNCASPAKHPRTRHGLQDATSDISQVEMWWDMFPTANIGVNAGKSGLLLLDIDPRNGGIDSAKELAATHGALPKTLTSQTGGGGVHYLFKRPAGGFGNHSGIRPGIDIKCDGGYFIADPSNHISGGRYEWLSDIDLEDAAEAPRWLLEVASNSKKSKAIAAGSQDGEIGTIEEGGRDNTLSSLAGSMRRKGFSQKAIQAAITVTNEEKCRPPLSADDMLRISSSIAKYRPTDVPATLKVKESEGLEPKILSAATLLSQPEEIRNSHFTQHFYYPAFGASCGPPRSGKGTLLLWIAFCISMGIPLAPGIDVVRRAPAVFFTNEDTKRRIRSRLKSIAIGYGIPFEEINDLHIMAKPKPTMHLPENLEEFKSILDPIGPKFIVIDGLSRISVGRDLLLDVEMQPVAEAIEDLRDRYEGSIELICHTTKAGSGVGLYKIKGAGCIPAAADHLIEYDRDEKKSRVTFSNSRDDDDWSMGFAEIWEGDGVKYVSDDFRPKKPEELPSRKPSKREQIPALVAKIHAEKRDGVLYEELAAALELTVDSIQKHVDILVSVKALRIVRGGGRNKPTLVYPTAK